MHLALSAMLSALASSAVATSFPPPASLRQCPGSTLDIPDAIRIHDKNGLVNFHYHYHYPPPITPPTAPPVEQLNVWVDGRVIFVVIIAALCVHQVARVFLRWSSDHNSTVASTKSIPPGRRAAVAGGSPVKRTSQAEQLALSFDQANVRENTEPSPSTGSVITPDPGPQNVDPEPDSRTENSSSIASTSGVRSYARCMFHWCGCVAQTKARIIWPDPSTPTHYPSIHQVIAGILSSGNVRPISYTGDETPPSPQLLDGQPGSNRRSSLIKSFIGSFTAREILAFSILVIALDWSLDRNASLPGVAYDIRWFEKMCSGLESFVALQLLTEATHDSIRLQLLQMHKNARSGTAIVVYLNGHGDGNYFMLYDGTVIDATTLIVWITEIRQKTGKHFPVCIVFDHCRFESHTPPSVNLGQDIHILWAGMPGQRSADLKMAGDDDSQIPCSNFLKTLALVLAEARARPVNLADCLMSRMNFWMDLVARMTRAEECRVHKCPTPCPLCSCGSYDCCVHPATRSRHTNPFTYPRIQNPNGLFWGFEDCVCISELIERLEPIAKLLLDRFQETAETIKKQEAYSAITNDRIPVDESNLFEPSSSQARRGRSVGAVAVSAQPLPM